MDRSVFSNEDVVKNNNNAFAPMMPVWRKRSNNRSYWNERGKKKKWELESWGIHLIFTCKLNVPRRGRRRRQTWRRVRWRRDLRYAPDHTAPRCLSRNARSESATGTSGWDPARSRSLRKTKCDWTSESEEKNEHDIGKNITIRWQAFDLPKVSTIFKSLIYIMAVKGGLCFRMLLGMF